MKYYVWYETETSLCGTPVFYGSLVAFKQRVKRNGWQIQKIEVEDANGCVVREEIYENNKKILAYCR